ncbi:glycosyltransferase family 2 protein [Roseicyclus mahoneyensis]|uniref:Cellulose synthase/poly-beta-1,6-N-acetylglucosamine synthase-like glycosyltransferase n=1 Tax=Roseicyclus mahoneyensis TaxID=164332 RepID=A0A316GKR8_9RHOB|nr:glycosyltransferase family 2 protein [Roseicyclus mahoneyensis]PWK61175.1 cellulose synthase/poly-beta-1,6-N-acetylglucosamine synthase-like glycosyltransferase [Roseicyclus mahoneyensis]
MDRDLTPDTAALFRFPPVAAPAAFPDSDARAMALLSRARLGERLRRPRPGAAALEALLLARGAITLTELASAREARRASDASIGEILLARGAISDIDLISALAECHGYGLSDLANRPPDPTLGRYLPAATALALEVVPTERIGNILVLATCRPDRAEAIRAALPSGMRMILTLSPRAQITMAQIALYGETLARLAEGQAPLNDSCRGWRPRVAVRSLVLSALSLAALAIFLPVAAIGLVFGLSLLIFGGNMALKATAFASALRRDRQKDAGEDQRPTPTLLRPPMVTLIAPLYQERDIAATLVKRLGELDYPPERLDVLLAVEADDATTRAALAATHLPPWIRVITVPDGQPRTKPRALNFALNFARGDIIGIYDAEDRPDPDQITRITERFANRPPEVACLQGRLDYYNARHNVLSRLFAIEYANWFRVLLPGVQRLGLVVPLGGTTLFLRHKVLVEVGGWDAHNVTEDAELGLRLARRGYRTEIIDTTTFEEANAAVLPWIRQRARWQKGYLMTWAMAMRAPRALWRDLGPVRFAALQVQMLFAVAGFLVAPLLWSLMVKPFGVAHPLDALVGPMGYGIMATAFVGSIVLSVALSIHATRAAHLRHLRPWIMLSELYFLLATISAARAAAEMLMRPFWWAKTTHGGFGGVASDPAADAAVRPEPSAPLP